MRRRDQRCDLTENGEAILRTMVLHEIVTVDAAKNKRELGGLVFPDRVDPAQAVERSCQKLREDRLLTRIIGRPGELARYFIAADQRPAVDRILEKHETKTQRLVGAL